MIENEEGDESPYAGDDEGAESGSDDIKAAGEKFLASLGENASKPFEKGVEDEVREKEARAGEDDDDHDDDDDEDDREEEVDENDEEEKEDEARPAKGEADKQAKDEAPAGSGKTVTVKLPGHKERGEDVLEIELPVEDQEVVDRIRRLAKDGLRAQEYETRMREVQSQQDELDDVRDALKADPANWIIENCANDRKLEVARALLAEHYDELQEDIEKYADATERKEARIDRREKGLESQKEIEALREKRAYTREVFASIAALIPDGADEKDRASFIDDAERDLLAEMRRLGKRIAPEDVKEVLDYRLRMYGFGKKKAATSTTRPLSDKAREIAQRRGEKPQDRMRRVAVRRKTAAAAGSPGTGAVSTRPPKASRGSTIEEVSRQTLARLKSSGSANSWGSTG